MRPATRHPLGLLACSIACLAAAGSTTAGDFLTDYAETYRFRLGKPTAITPTPDGRHLLFLRSAGRDFERRLFEQEIATGAERELLSAQELMGGGGEELTDEERARRERMRLVARGIAAYQLSQDGSRILIPLSGRIFLFERASGESREITSERGAAVDARLSPDGKRVACVRGGELFVIDLDSGHERRLTQGAGDGVTHGLAEFVAQEEMRRYRGFWWSPDSSRLAYQRTDTAGVELLSIADGMHPERPPSSAPYPRPGMRNASVELGLVSIAGGETTWIDWDRDRYEYLASVDWSRHGPLTLLVQNRLQTESRLLAVDPQGGATKSLLVERDDAWLAIDPAVPLWLPDGRGFLWTTERRGAWQLELRDTSGKLVRELTAVDLGLQAFVKYRPGPDDVIVRASLDPTESHLFRIPLSTDGGARAMTRASGQHAAIFGRTGEVWVQRVTPARGAERWEVMKGDDATGHALRSVAVAPPFEPNLEYTTVGDDPPLHAVLIRPHDFDPARRYPVIDHVYGGPTSQMVRKGPGRYLLDQWMANHGYIVVAIDGRGTPNRGREWQRAVKHDLIRLPLEDQVQALRLLGERYAELDLSRVGIYGWSFGGYFSALAAMREGQLFRAAVAGAPVVDWRDYDTHYTERYMARPSDNPDGYDAANVLTYAGQLERPLLIIHGTADDNVYFMHSLKLADALFREGKTFEFLPLAGFTHMVPDPLVTRRLYGRIMRFLEKNLRAAAPCAEVAEKVQAF